MRRYLAIVVTFFLFGICMLLGESINSVEIREQSRLAFYVFIPSLMTSIVYLAWSRA